MPKLRLSFSDPDVLVVERPEAVWVLSGLERSDVHRIRESNRTVNGLESDLAARAGDASIVKIHLSFGRATVAEVWKPAISYREVFYCWTSGGDLVISDHFRTLLSQLPLADRTVAPESVVDFFLFNTVPGTHSMCSAIKRMGRGDVLTIDLASRQIRTSIFDRIETRERPGSEADYVDRLDAVLSDIIEPFKREPGIANLFSGGVDSVLVHTYLGTSVPAVFMDFESLKIDSPYETGYAQRAADLLGLDLQTHPIREADYLPQLESTVDALGRPPLFLSMIYYDQAFQQNYRLFMNGEGAGSLLGESTRLARAASYFASPLGIAFLKLVGPLLPGKARPGLRTLLPNAIGLSKDPRSPLGYAGRSATDTDFSLLERVFGSDLVEQRLNARLEYILQRLISAAPQSNRFLQHVEIAQWVSLLSAGHTVCWRQLAQAYSKSLVTPYTSRTLTNTVLEIPVVDRYVKGLQGKYLLKQVLQKRLPGYPVSQRKAYLHISFERYYESGPLSTIWERYQFPDFVDRCSRNLILDGASALTWHAVAYAIWQDRVLNNSNLRGAPDQYVQEWPL
jgi:asparagine synthase (glutamine-hydrolysing)